MTIQIAHDRLPLDLEIALVEIRRQQPNTTADVESHSTRGDNPTFGNGGCCYPADGKAVAPVDVGHSEAGFNDARKVSDIGHLFGGSVSPDLAHQFLGSEDPSRHAHSVGRRKLIEGLADTLEVHSYKMPYL